MKLTTFWLFLLLAWACSSDRATQAEPPPAYSAPPELQPFFEQDFQQFPQGTFKPLGNGFDHREGSLRILSGGGFSVALSSGPKFVCSMIPQWPEVDVASLVLVAQPNGVSDVASFSALAAGEAFGVRITRNAAEAGPAQLTFEIFLADEEGRPKRTLKSNTVPCLEQDRIPLTVQYNYGVVRCLQEKQVVIEAYANIFPADFHTVSFHAGQHHVRLRSIAIERTPAAPTFTLPQKVKLLRAGAEDFVRAQLESDGNFREAINVCERIHAVCLSVLGEYHPYTESARSNLALNFNHAGDYSSAMQLREKSVQSAKRLVGKRHPSYANQLNNLAGLVSRMGDYERAEPLFLEAMRIRQQVLGEDHDDFVNSLHNLAWLQSLMGNDKKARQYYEQALPIAERVLGESHRDVALLMDNLANVYQVIGDDAKAEPLMWRALEIRKEVLGEQHPEYAWSLQTIAWHHRRKRQYSEAEKAYRQAIEINENLLGKQHPHYADSLSGLAGLYRSTGKPAEAEALYNQALTITLAHLDATASVLSEQQQLTMNQSVRYQLDNHITCCLDLKAQQSRAIEHIVAWKGSVLVRQRGLRLAASDPAISDQFHQLQLITQRLSTLTRVVPESEKLGDWKQKLAGLLHEKEQLEADLMKRSALFREAKNRVSLEDIRKAIPEDAVLIDYLVYDGDHRDLSIVASVIRRHGELTMLDLGSADAAGAAVDMWRKSYGTTQEGREAGAKLRDQLWQPLVQHIRGADLVLVSTDGALGRFPLVALPGTKNGSYLIEEQRMALIPVPQLLPALASNERSGSQTLELLLMGDVDYDSSVEPEPASKPAGKRRPRPWERGPSEGSGVNSNWRPLDETGLEVEFIGGLYRRIYQPEDEAVLDLRGRAASETAFRKHAPESRVMHLATHGYFASPKFKSALSPEQFVMRGSRGWMLGGRPKSLRAYGPGQLSGIVLAGANRPPLVESLSETVVDDGIMTADEIACMRLGGVQLAVLSACETGLGEVAGGEGLLGIQRAFQVAGARTTVASLWKVNDWTTRRIMQEFYQNYLDPERNLSILDALRESQLWALNHPSELFRGTVRKGKEFKSRVSEIDHDVTPQRLSPRYWAPFVLSGDWR